MEQTAIELENILNILYNIKDDVFYFKEYGNDLISSFVEQAKQIEKQQQVYSEEDMNDYANYRLLIKKSLSPKEWFEQFKKK